VTHVTVERVFDEIFFFLRHTGSAFDILSYRADDVVVCDFGLQHRGGVVGRRGAVHSCAPAYGCGTRNARGFGKTTQDRSSLSRVFENLAGLEFIIRRVTL
jgi:hypothetical protein